MANVHGIGWERSSGVMGLLTLGKVVQVHCFCFRRHKDRVWFLTFKNVIHYYIKPTLDIFFKCFSTEFFDVWSHHVNVVAVSLHIGLFIFLFFTDDE